MQLLGYLVLKAHRRDWRRLRKRKKCKQIKEFSRQFDHIALVRIPNLVVPHLKLNGEPRDAEILQLDVAWLHYIVERNATGLCWRKHSDLARKAVPSSSKSLIQQFQERIQIRLPGCVEIHRHPGEFLSVAESESASAFDNTVTYHLGHDGVCHLSPQVVSPCEIPRKPLQRAVKIGFGIWRILHR